MKINHIVTILQVDSQELPTLCGTTGRALIFIDCELYSGLERTSGNGR
jgi:hypothetical protein